MSTKQEHLPPQYSALERCVIVESRFSVRQEIINSIKAAQLFEKVIQAESLNDGINKIRTLNLDACFIGTSIAPENVEKFLEKASKQKLSPDCSFIAVVKEGKEEDTAQITKAHGIVSWPCSKKNFVFNVAKAVVKANSNSPWKSLLEKFQVENEEEKQKQEMIVLCAEELKKIAIGIRDKKYALDADGNADSLVKNDIEKIVAVLVMKLNKEQDAETVREFFYRILTAWVENQIKLSPQEARKILQNELLSFRLE